MSAEQRAIDEALQHLVDEVTNLRLAGGQGLSLLLAGTAEGDRALREAVFAKCERGQARPLPGGDVEINVWVSAQVLGEVLRGALSRYLPAAEAKQLVLPEGLGPMVAAAGRYHDDGWPRDDRPGWRWCDARIVALAQAAARIDLRESLINRLTRLRLADQQTVGELMREYPLFGTAVRQRAETLAAGEPVFEPTGLCRLTISIARAEVISLLSEAATASGERVGGDFAEINEAPAEDPLVVNGYGVAPLIGASVGGGGKSEAGRPNWADQFLIAKAAGKVPADGGDEPTRRQLAAQAARIEAMRQLWIQIEALPLPEGGTIRSLLEQDPAAVGALSAIDDAIFPTATPVFDKDGTATVSVGVRLGTVWQIVRDLPRGR